MNKLNLNAWADCVLFLCRAWLINIETLMGTSNFPLELFNGRGKQEQLCIVHQDLALILHGACLEFKEIIWPSSPP